MVIEQDAGFEGNSGMNITDCQKEVLDTLRCERLSSKENNLREISTFYNTRNSCSISILKSWLLNENVSLPHSIEMRMLYKSYNEKITCYTFVILQRE